MGAVEWLRFLGIFVLSLRSAYSAYCSTNIVRIANGDYSFRSGNSVVLFQCNPGFTLLGAKQIVCFGSQWSHDPPMCIANTCTEIHESPTLRITKLYDGAMLKFSCTVMHKLEGVDKLVCDGTNWSDDPPVCQAWDPLTSCDFENVLLCGWSHHEEDDQDWRWHTGATKTTRTGPTHDHTLGRDGYGHYMYFESSSPTRTGHEAWLSSPLYPMSYSGDYCFQFWYHSLGSGEMGEMKVFIKPEMVNLTDVQHVFYLNTSIDDAWHSEMITLPKQTGPFHIVFTARRGASYRSDFAIDDVLLQKCDEFTTTSKTTQTTTMKTTTTTVATTAAPSSTRRPITTTQTTRTNASTAKPTASVKITSSNTATTKKPTTPIATKSPTEIMTSKRMLTTTLVSKQTTNQVTKTTKSNNLNPSSVKGLFTTTQNAQHSTSQPNAPVTQKSRDSAEGPSTAALPAFISVGVIVCIAFAVGLGYYLYRRNKRKYTWSKDSSFASDNPLYRIVAEDDSAVQFANLQDD